MADDTISTLPYDEVPDDERERFANALLEKHCSQLIEHFASVRIIATAHLPQQNSTAFASRGQGDYYAQYGAVRTWLVRQDAMNHHDAAGE